MEIGASAFVAPSRKRRHRIHTSSDANNSSDIAASVRCLDKLYTNRRTYDCALFGTSNRLGLREEEEISTSATFHEASSAPKKNRILNINSSALGCIPCAYKIGTFDVALDSIFTQRCPNQRPECCPRGNVDKFPCAVGEQRTLSGFGYHRGMNILCIGDGDFSFSLALARALLVEGDIDQCHSKIVATSYESLSALECIYGKERLWRTLQEVEHLGVQVCYNVDATDLRKSLPLCNEGFFHRIIWNFPCTAVENGQDGQNDEMERNKELIRKFVVSASYMLHAACGEIHIAHKTKPPFDKWKIEEEVTSCSLFNTIQRKRNETDEGASPQDHHENATTLMTYCGRIVFDRCCFPPYIPRKAKHSKSFTYHDACIYVFTLKPKSTTAVSLFPPTIPISFCDRGNTCEELVPVTNEMIQRIRYIHLQNSSHKKSGRKKQKKVF